MIVDSSTGAKQQHLKNPNFLSNHTVPFEVSEMEVQDIDNQSDWELAELKFQMCRGKE